MAKNTQQTITDEKDQKQESNDRKVILLMGMGINGINAEGWIPPAETKEQAEEMFDDMWNVLESVDTFILGRVTFEMWESYWPLQAKKPSNSEFQKKFSLYADKVKKITFSKTLKEVKWQNARVVNGDIGEEIARIKKEPGKNIAIVGGPGIAQTFTKLNLIDEYQLYLHQVIFGANKSVLGELDKERELELLEAKVFQSGGMRLHYCPKK